MGLASDHALLAAEVAVICEVEVGSQAWAGIGCQRLARVVDQSALR